MFLMYIDESGDVGLKKDTSGNIQPRYFVLSGIVVHESRWQKCLYQIMSFRLRMQRQHKLRMYQEIHTSIMLGGKRKKKRFKYFKDIPRHDRLQIVRNFATELGKMQDITIINVVIDKQDKDENYPVFEMAWITLIQSFEDAIFKGLLRGHANSDERGMIFPDKGNDDKIRRLLRNLQIYNPIPIHSTHGVPYQNSKINLIVDDPNIRDSEHSFFIQASDVVAYLLSQKLRREEFKCSTEYKPKKEEKKKFSDEKSVYNYFDNHLDGILCRDCCKEDKQGIIRL